MHDKAHDQVIARSMVLDARAELLAERDAWDAGMTPAQRAEAIAAEVKATAERAAAPLPASWSDPRTANLLGNYVTR
jgi:hypothetical protein